MTDDVETPGAETPTPPKKRDYAYFAAHRTEQRFEFAPTRQILLERLIKKGEDVHQYDFFRGLKVELRVNYRL